MSQTLDSNSASTRDQPLSRTDAPLYQVRLWPNRSLPRQGFHQILAFTAFMLAIPLIPLLGSPVALALLPFLLGTLALLYLFIQRNYKDGQLTEELHLWPDLISVVRKEPRGAVKDWQANPYWVSIHLHKDAKLENYLTLKGNGREIELGAFLSPEERAKLFEDLQNALNKARSTYQA